MFKQKPEGEKNQSGAGRKDNALKKGERESTEVGKLKTAWDILGRGGCGVLPRSNCTVLVTERFGAED